MPRPSKALLLRLLLILPIPALWCMLHYTGRLAFLENFTVDWRFKWRGELPPPLKVVYVDIDSKSITDIGNLPWDRAYFADVCEAVLGEGRARVVGIDYIFSERGRPEVADMERFQRGTWRLAQYLFQQPEPPVVVAASYAAADDRDINGMPIVRQFPRVLDPPEAEPEPPELPEFRVGNRIYNAPNVGLIDTMAGSTREVPMFAQVGPMTWWHMSLEIARLYWKLPPSAIRLEDGRIVLVGGDGARLAEIPLRDGQDLEVNWFSKWESPHNLRMSFTNVLVAARMLKSEIPEDRQAAARLLGVMEGAIVLIGPVDPLLFDTAPTSLDDYPVPRVGIHGNLLKTIFSKKFLRHPAPVFSFLIILGTTAVVCAMSLAGGARGVIWKGVAMLLMVGYVWISFEAFGHGHWILPVIAPLGASFTTCFAAIVMQLVEEEGQKRRIKGMFGTYISPELVNQMVESGEEPKLGGSEVPITAYFSDIQNFTQTAESLSPVELVEWMNQYLSVCTDAITQKGGALDKYIGDAVVAMFGAPVAQADHASRACVAACRVHQRLGELRKQWMLDFGARWGGVWRMCTRIGLNTGVAVVGNMGSRSRFNYTMMGDTVNLASRLEAVSRIYGVDTLVAGSTRAEAERAGCPCVFRLLDTVVVKGRSQPVDVFEVMGLAEELPPMALECRGLFGEGLELYRRQDWDRAAALFMQASRLECTQTLIEGQLTPSRLFMQRCMWMKANPPPPDWNGIFTMETK
ncbi:adenylate/guanylate cyclase domain-containing protein [Termitidicoccus mucosus]|uniref:CHASE2 domain-containing protein n=1 Tax=Termitidicoccus mucosus TaxID=1184151 RepID=UPI002FEE1CB0